MIKSVNIKRLLLTDNLPPASFRQYADPQANDVTYLGIHLDRRLTWRKYMLNLELAAHTSL